MRIIKTFTIIFFIFIRTINGQSQANQIYNHLNGSVVNTTKDHFGCNYSLNDSITTNRGISLVARIGYSFYDLKNKNGMNLYTADIVSGFRFSKYYFLGLGIGLNPIQRDIGLYAWYSNDTLLDNQGNLYSVNKFNIHVLQSNYLIFINQRVTYYGSRKTSYSLNVNTGVSLSHCYDITYIYNNYYYLNSSSSKSQLKLNPYLSLGLGVKRIINRNSAVLLDFETDYIPFLKSDNFSLVYFAIKLGYEFNIPILKK